ncbi:MAG: prepilin-type N-terminal cleavage/methylation domain-containing protein [Kiritimatiellae bacterium]|nr:prepilin-type N-terminal cleavage/methylation domain-containing protein [Kiritimatiellia bacterium]
MRRGFTLIELLVVIAMVAVLMGAVGSGMNQARRRAMISKATQDVKEITNAILAYENYAPGRTLSGKATGADWKDTDEGAMSMILGGDSAEGGGEVPVLYNAHIVGGAIRDPWGTPYQYMIRPAGEINPKSSVKFYTAYYLPNFYRLSDEDRRYKGDDE